MEGCESGVRELYGRLRTADCCAVRLSLKFSLCDMRRRRGRARADLVVPAPPSVVFGLQRLT